MLQQLDLGASSCILYFLATLSLVPSILDSNLEANLYLQLESLLSNLKLNCNPKLNLFMTKPKQLFTTLTRSNICRPVADLKCSEGVVPYICPTLKCKGREDALRHFPLPVSPPQLHPLPITPYCLTRLGPPSKTQFKTHKSNCGGEGVSMYSDEIVLVPSPRFRFQNPVCLHLYISVIQSVVFLQILWNFVTKFGTRFFLRRS